MHRHEHEHKNANDDEIASADNSDGSELLNAVNSAFHDSDDAPNAPITVGKQTKRIKDNDDSALYAGGLHKSSIFNLQVDEMLAEVRLNYDKQFSGADDALRRLKGLIEAIEEKKPLSIPDATKALQKFRKVTVPFPNPKPNTNAAYKLAYVKPSSVNVVGSYALRSMVKTDDELSIDMVIVMSRALFQEKDFLNYRYFYKRAYFLACIAAGILEAVDDEFSLGFEYLNGNSLHSILVVKPKHGKDKISPSRYKINVIPAAPQNLFPESKLLPLKNAIRPEDTGVEAARLPTPFYNASLRSDGNYEAYLKLFHSASKQSAGFADACLLGRIWLRQRGFEGDVSKGGFGHFEWAALTALLLEGGGTRGQRVLSPEYSSYQMFKSVVQYLSSTDLARTPSGYAVSEFETPRSGYPIFYDGSRGQNVLYKMTPWSYGLLQDEARTSLGMLNDATFDQFEPTFIWRTSQPLQRYDCIMRVPLPRKTPEMSGCDHLSDTAIFSQCLFEVLSQGLSDRVKLIYVSWPKSLAWSIKTSSPSGSREPLLISIVFDPMNIDRLVDHGPAAEEKKKAAQFQKFWGEKAELRRFKDGSILECLVWRTGSSYSIFQDVVVHLIRRHFDAEVSEGLTLIGESFAKALPSPTTSLAAFKGLEEAFSSLEKNVRELEGLPLQLRQFSATSPQLRYSAIDPPSFGPQKPLKTPADVLIQFEGSGRWPDDIVAIQRTKMAFLLKIGNLLEESNENITARVGLENADQTMLNCAFLDVIYDTGPVFRIRIHSDREQTLLERMVKDKSMDPRARDNAVSALSIYKKTFVQLPLLNQSISTHCTRFPLLSPTIRLAKLWFDRHMLLAHIGEELVELIVAGVFLQPYPWRAPSSVMSGFLRTLMFISKWDWRLVPLIVDFTGNMKSPDISTINTRLEAWRKIDPGMNRTVIFAASNHDRSGMAFTDKSPSKMVAARMTALAVSAYKLVKEKGIELDQRFLFASSTADYDFVIHISPKFNGQKESSKKQKFKNLEVQSEANLDAIGYDPVQLFVDDLQKLYASSIVLFRCTASSSVIAGLWNPQAAAPRAFKVNMAHAMKTVGDGENDNEKEEIEIDNEAVLSEIARLGGDMVSRIEVRR